MKNITFQQIQETVNQILAKNGLKKALNIEVKASMSSIEENDFFIVSIYQFERCSRGLKKFHCFTCDSMAMLKFHFQNSIDEKANL
jgi:xylose isomerase